MIVTANLGADNERYDDKAAKMNVYGLLTKLVK